MKKTSCIILAAVLCLAMLCSCNSDYETPGNQYTDDDSYYSEYVPEVEEYSSDTPNETSSKAPTVSKKPQVSYKPQTSSKVNNTVSKSECSHSWKNATCTAPMTCEYCGKTSGGTNDHYYTSTTTKKATCSEEGEITYKCYYCGKTYTETTEKTNSHSWESATCTSPKTCKNCGETEGEAKGHNYAAYNGYKCTYCKQVDPNVQEVLGKCSLQLPTLPTTLTRYSYSNKVQHKVTVTDIKYEFEYYGDGKVTLTAKFAGTKVYDEKGSGQSSSCYIGWKLYAPDGTVFRSGTFMSPNVAEGESFGATKEENLIYNFEASDPGNYKLVIMNTN